MLIIDYYRKKIFYNNFKEKLEKLDQKYLIVELLDQPSFLEGKILTDSLYEIDKSMLDRINKYKVKTQDFKEYVELWIHEVKLPISSLTLMLHNRKTEENKKLIDDLRHGNYSKELFRNLQQYVVNLYERDFKKLDEACCIEYIDSYFYILSDSNYYSDKTGITFPDDNTLKCIFS